MFLYRFLRKTVALILIGASSLVAHVFADDAADCGNFDVTGNWAFSPLGHEFVGLTQNGNCESVFIRTGVQSHYIGNAYLLLPFDKNKTKSLLSLVDFFNRNQEVYGSKTKILYASATASVEKDAQGIFLSVLVTGTAEIQRTVTRKFDFTFEVIVTPKKDKSCGGDCSKTASSKKIKLWVGHLKITNTYDGSTADDVKKDLVLLAKFPSGVVEDWYRIFTLENNAGLSSISATTPIAYRCIAGIEAQKCSSTFSATVQELSQAQQPLNWSQKSFCGGKDDLNLSMTLSSAGEIETEISVGTKGGASATSKCKTPSGKIASGDYCMGTMNVSNSSPIEFMCSQNIVPGAYVSPTLDATQPPGSTTRGKSEPFPSD